jgi:hypothetical protein
VRRLVAEALDVDGATYERCVGDRLREEPHGMRRRHRMVVEKILEEVALERAVRQQQEGQSSA